MFSTNRSFWAGKEQRDLKDNKQQREREENKTNIMKQDKLKGINKG